jgi:hypothetical protein
MRAAAPAALGPAIVRVLRLGTLAAVAGIGVGYLLGAIGGQPERSGRSVLELIMDGGGDALVAAGLLVLAVTPGVALATAAGVLARSGERQSALVAAGVVALLVLGFLAAAVLGATS